MAEAASGRRPRLIVEMPPRHGKSELVSHWSPVWYLNLWPGRHVMLASYEAEFAAAWGRRVRNTIKEHQGSLRVSMADDSQAAHRWATSEGGGMVTAGVGGPLTGRGANLLLCDDPIKNAQEAASPTIRKRVWDWWTSTAYTRMEPGAAAILVMTRWHEDDLAGRLQAQMAIGGEQWDVIRLPALAEEHDPLGRRLGQALWPARFDEPAFADIQRAVGSRVWSALYQQHPSPDEGGIFRRGWWRFYKAAPECDEYLQSWDMAFKDTDGSDYVVGQVWGRRKADKYLLDQVRGRLDFVATAQAVRTLSAKWPAARLKLVEDKANGPAVISALSREISGMVPIDPQGGKLSRAQAVSPQVEAGNVYLPDPGQAPWVHDFIEECAAFPNAAHDDCVDAMSQALHRLESADGLLASMRRRVTGCPACGKMVARAAGKCYHCGVALAPCPTCEALAVAGKQCGACGADVPAYGSGPTRQSEG